MTQIVLVHGAYQGGWIWRDVAAALRSQGHDVRAPTLDGCAERAGALRRGITTETHAEEIARLLFHEDLTDATLVGTSTGGMAMCRAAELARDLVGRLVFLDALALLPGEAVPDIVDRRNTVTTELATGPSRADAETRLFADFPPTLRAWALERTTPHPRAVLEAPIVLNRFWDLPWRATVVRCRRSTNPPEAHQRRAATRLAAAYEELDTG
ncbi:MAG: alpha/beta fold hydrolase, partial [Acetobacteraceae bacterium]